jgi:hypothetical protein
MEDIKKFNKAPERNKLANMKGVIYFKENEDSIHMIRLLSDTVNEKGIVNILDFADKTRRPIPATLLEEYKPLEPDGFFTANIVTVIKSDGTEDRDVICTINKMLEIKYVGDMKPYAICRQSCNDIFHALTVSEEDQIHTGVSVNRDDCPTNFDYLSLLACNGMIQTDSINFYRMDTVEDILSLFSTAQYDATLLKLYKTHIKYKKRFFKENAEYDQGWCRNLKTLLKTNNFQSDINEMLGIIDIDFNIKDYLVKKSFTADDGTDVEYDSMNDELRIWFSSIMNINIKDSTALEYFFDIDLSDFNNHMYTFIRNNDKKLFFVTFIPEGQYLGSDLETEANKMDFSTKFKLCYFDKYNSESNSTNIRTFKVKE